MHIHTCAHKQQPIGWIDQRAQVKPTNTEHATLRTKHVASEASKEHGVFHMVGALDAACFGLSLAPLACIATYPLAVVRLTRIIQHQVGSEAAQQLRQLLRHTGQVLGVRHAVGQPNIPAAALLASCVTA